MTLDDALPDAGGPDRRRWLIIGGGVVVAIAVIIGVVALAGGGDDDDDADRASSTSVPDTVAETSIDTSASVPATTTTTTAPPTSSTAPTSATTVASTTAAPAVSPPPTSSSPPTTVGPPPPVVTEFPELSVPLGTIPGDNEVEVCAAIKDRLAEYRQLAVDNPIPAIRQLLPGMEEFELDIFTAADLQEWGDLLVEQLVNVRREWSTALSADEAGESAEAQARADSALAYLDAALAVPCPEA